MALTETQKQKILRYVGWPDIFIRENRRFYSSTIDKRFQNLTPEAEADAIELLNRCLEIDAQLAKATSRLTVNSVGNIRLNREEISMLRSERQKIVNEMQTPCFCFLRSITFRRFTNGFYRTKK